MEMGEGESIELQRWRMVCDVDVDVDVGRSMGLGLGLKRGESRWRNREGRERRELKYRDSGERNFRGKKGGIKNIYIYIYFFFLEYCYSTILKLELYCSTIAKNFAIVGFTIF